MTDRGREGLGPSLIFFLTRFAGLREGCRFASNLTALALVGLRRTNGAAIFGGFIAYQLLVEPRPSTWVLSNGEGDPLREETSQRVAVTGADHQLAGLGLRPVADADDLELAANHCSPFDHVGTTRVRKAHGFAGATPALGAVNATKPIVRLTKRPIGEDAG